MKMVVVNFNNDTVGEVELAEDIFGVDVRPDIMARVVKWQLAKRQAGTHKTKTRGEVHHTTKKPFKQKGTGSARQGMKSTPNMRHGGIALGPVPRSHAHDLTKKVRRLGLRSALSAKVQEGKLIVIDNLQMQEVKTKAMQENIKNMKLRSALFIDGAEVDQNFRKSCANIIGLDVLPTIGANVYDILQHDTLVVTKEAVELLSGRLK